MTSGDRVKLTEAARSLFPDIGTRIGTVLAMDGWPLVAWLGLDVQVRIDPRFLEVCDAGVA